MAPAVLPHRAAAVIVRASQQQLAGVVVNRHPNPARDEFDVLKAILSHCIRAGVDMREPPDTVAHCYHSRHAAPAPGGGARRRGGRRRRLVAHSSAARHALRADAVRFSTIVLPSAGFENRAGPGKRFTDRNTDWRNFVIGSAIGGCLNKNMPKRG
ncbi:hypothetical protein [Burkholderia sp. 22313]|uniref:hypothetical protein n=1 Tax=Burkholderia sp. 22313 TaxID=3453908 RepID=UPI002C179862|nr:hypothetical protein [Burkholderia sp.]